MKYKEGDKVYCRPIKSIWQGIISEVVTEWGDKPYYIVEFGWGFCARRECELFDTEEEAKKHL